MTLKTPPLTVQCPDCGSVLTRRLSPSRSWVYECPKRGCEFIDARFNPRMGVYDVRREARAGAVDDPPAELSINPYPPRMCPGCGARVEVTRVRRSKRSTEYYYRCLNVRCWVSRFRYDRDGGLVTSPKTPRHYPYLRR